MPSPVVILAFIAGALCVIALIPAAEKWPLVAVAGLLLSVALLIIGAG